MATNKEPEVAMFLDYYKILQCDRNANSEELKKGYQRLVLTLHPDKSGKESESDNQFVLLQKAWTVLRDPEMRKQYDAELSCREHSDCLLYDTVTLSDMDCSSGEQFYSYPCRCGGSYALESSSLLQQNVVIPCDNCSFSIAVNIDTCS